MGATGLIIVLLCYTGTLLPPLIGTISGHLWDAITARRLRGGRSAGEVAVARVRASRASQGVEV